MIKSKKFQNLVKLSGFKIYFKKNYFFAIFVNKVQYKTTNKNRVQINCLINQQNCV